MTFERDPSHWLLKWSPSEWIQAALSQLKLAESAYASRDGRGGIVGAKRAAGMALNAALIVEPNETWGRSYVDHLAAVARDKSVPDAVRAACLVLLETPPPGGAVVVLRSPKSETRVLEAAKDVMAHAYSKVKKHENP